MSVFANLKVGGSTAIDLTDDGLRSGISDIVEPCFDGDFRCSFRDISKAEKIGIGGRVDPNGRFQLGGDAGRLRRVETWAWDFQDAAELEIVADDLSEKGRVGFGGVGAG